MLTFKLLKWWRNMFFMDEIKVVNTLQDRREISQLINSITGFIFPGGVGLQGGHQQVKPGISHNFLQLGKNLNSS